MRGPDVTQEKLFSIRQTADFVPQEHPLVARREILNQALRDMDLLFESMYEDRGRNSAPPEWLLRGLVLQALYGIRSERLLCEQLGYNMLYRWFVGLGMEDAAWDHSTYTQNRDRLIEHDAVRALFEQVMKQAEAAQLLSDEHFSVDGTESTNRDHNAGETPEEPAAKLTGTHGLVSRKVSNASYGSGGVTTCILPEPAHA